MLEWWTWLAMEGGTAFQEIEEDLFPPEEWTIKEFTREEMEIAIKVRRKHIAHHIVD